MIIYLLTAVVEQLRYRRGVIRANHRLTVIHTTEKRVAIIAVLLSTPSWGRIGCFVHLEWGRKMLSTPSTLESRRSLYASNKYLVWKLLQALSTHEENIHMIYAFTNYIIMRHFRSVL